MELAEHFTNFYETILDDPRISPVHIGLYMALLLAFEQNERINPIPIQRNRLMKRAKISSTSTYYTVLKDFWSRTPWSLSNRYYVCYDDGKVKSFGRADAPTSG